MTSIVRSERPELPAFRLRQRAKFFFFNKKIDSRLLGGELELGHALRQLRACVELVASGEFRRGQLAEVPAVLARSPSLQESCRRYIGFGLHGFNQVPQGIDAALVDCREARRVQRGGRFGEVQDQRDGATNYRRFARRRL